MSNRLSKQNLVETAREKLQQMKSRAESALAGTRGRREHKGGATTANKHTGGKQAR